MVNKLLWRLVKNMFLELQAAQANDKSQSTIKQLNL